VRRLTDIEWSQLRRAAAGENISSSDRPSDRARTKLKRLGLLEYNRAFARWLVTDLGRSALEQSEEGK
jgi:hypothetical protein